MFRCGRLTGSLSLEQPFRPPKRALQRTVPARFSILVCWLQDRDRREWAFRTSGQSVLLRHRAECDRCHPGGPAMPDIWTKHPEIVRELLKEAGYTCGVQGRSWSE